ncbi:PqiC family protein [Marinomonas posidonica]|uniref:ABC-type transport auxiliary lipoprotein component domain-containing protein n=1 Tax=Marinomonas posidonica (strain CECT 7376 / NCIMB 14433 / IVIA-Po-181) TaxID=491952 RepID=F6CUS1_MARPP|nr:ABC-type transport auxiliary lipoprotein family protein [Marinomonas posidonica]AEF54181.1 protein of unknown function DUF330 [Marinomonas posidonica IVIA-Po-181]
MLVRIMVLSLIAGVLMGCASQTPLSYEYLLIDSSSDKVDAIPTAPMQIQMMPVVVANYLSGNEIVLVSKSGGVHRSQSHLWAEPLAPQLTRLTQQRFEKSLTNISWYARQRLPSYAIAQLNIEVDRFYADLQGRVNITGRWQLMSAEGKILNTQVFDVSDYLRSDGYATLTQTLASNWINQVVDPMAKQIAAELNTP